MKANDRDPPLSLYFSELVNGSNAPINLTDKTVRIVMVAERGRKLIFDEEATIVDAANGYVEYYWKDGDTSVPGNYLIIAHVTDTITGKTRTFPNSGYYSWPIDPNYSSGLKMPAATGTVHIFGNNATLTWTVA